MRIQKPLSLLTASIISVFAFSYAGAQTREDSFRRAKDLYENGLYEKARSIFEAIPDDPAAEAYAALCAAKANTSDYPDLIIRLETRYPKTVLSSELHYQYALNLFDAEEYAAAQKEFKKVDGTALVRLNAPEYNFKRGYCSMDDGDFAEARRFFGIVDTLPKSPYTAAARYQMGFMAYSDKNFEEALGWFEQTEKDARFKTLSEYYIMECRFMLKDYAYVVEHADDMMETVPEERKGRLARIVSESYLVQGDAAKAMEFYARQPVDTSAARSRTDLFFSGSVLYAGGDYEGAIESFERMEDRSDSLGQIANYNLGYCYIKTKNKVAAADAFAAAKAVEFNKDIREDAWFNYAKLAFDINSDNSVFEAYLKEYSTDKKGDQIYSYMAMAALGNRNYAAAIDAYSHIDTLDDEQKSNFTKANYLRAHQLITSGSYRDAMPFLKAAGYYLPKHDRMNQLARYWLAESAYRSGSFSYAAGIYTELYNIGALRGMQEGAMLPYNLGYSYYSESKYENASKWFDAYIASRDPFSREDALTRRADCDFARRNYKAAVKSYQKVINEFSSPDHIYPYYQQALAYGLSGDKYSKVKVLANVKRASTDAPMYSEAMYELGRAYMDIDRNLEAVSCFEKLKTSTSDNTYAAKAMIGEGMAYRNMKEYDKALRQYEQVVTVMPNSEYSEEALLAINSIYQTTRQPEKYIEYMETNNLTVGKTSAEKEMIYFNTAEQVYLAGNYSQALVSLRKYLDDYPGGAKAGDATFYLAESYRALGDKERACEYYRQVPRLLRDGSFAEMAALHYANLSFELERFDDAYSGYSTLADVAVMDVNKGVARAGKMRSAYRARRYEEAIVAARAVREAMGSGADLRREADWIEAKSDLATSRRDEAFVIFNDLSRQASTPEGAEASYMLIQNLFDSGEFDSVESKVYEFASKAGSQSYWLAKAYIVLGDAFAEKGNKAQAKVTWESIRAGYTPADGGDDVLDNVKLRLDRLQSSESL